MTRQNLITDIPGLAIGNAHDSKLASGVTVALFDERVVASISVLGGASAGRDLGCLEPDATVERIDAIVLSGGSGYGLDAAGGVQAWLRDRGRGFRIRDAVIPIVPQAICFDLLNGGDKAWGRYPPYRDLGFAACEDASRDFTLGSIGGGFGATTVDLKGGLGSASSVTASGFTVGAIVIVNAIGSAVIGGGPHFWAGGLEEDDEFGGLGLPVQITPEQRRARWKGGPQPGTTIALVATDALLTKPQAKRLAINANDGLARALRVTHAPFDGDTIFAAATGERAMSDPVNDFTDICTTAADCLARAIARGVYEATELQFAGALPAWGDLFGRRA